MPPAKTPRKPRAPKAPTWTDEERLARTTKRLPLIGQGWARGVDVAYPMARDHDCRRCPLQEFVKTVCMDPFVDGDDRPGGIVAVLDAPTQSDDSVHEVTPSGYVERVLDEIRKHFPESAGPVYVTHAVGCAGGSRIEPEHVEACRGYLAHEILARKPSRILAFGGDASLAVTGYRVDTLSVRRGWTRALGIPTYVLIHPGVATHNKFASEWFRRDVQWAVLEPPGEILEGEVRVLTTGDEVRAYLKTLKPGEVTDIDLEWAGGKNVVWTNKLHPLTIQMCSDVRYPVILTRQAVAEAKDALKRYFESPRYFKCGHNFKQDTHVIYRWIGAEVKGVVTDTLLWGRMWESDFLSGLKVIGWNVGWGGYAGDVNEAAADEEDGKDFGKVEPDTLHLYGGRDVVVTRLARGYLGPKLARYQGTWDQIVRPAQEALAQVERWGALLSEQNVRTYNSWLSGRLDELDRKLTQHVPTGFNPASYPQTAKFLFGTDPGQLGLKPLRRTDSGANSTDSDTLEALKDKHPVIPLLIEHSTYRKQKSTYGVGVLKHIGYDGRVHTDYRVVRSGRLGSRNPNMQNVTSPGIKPGEPGWDERRWTDPGVQARGCWVPPAGYLLVQGDFAQMELRIAAMLSGDEVMAAAFEGGHDFHKMTAAAAYNVRPEDVDAGQRRVAKEINFSLVFGMDAYGLHKSMEGKGIRKTLAECETLLGNLLGKYRRFKEWQTIAVLEAERTGESFVRWNPNEHVDWSHRRNIWQIGEVGQSRRSEGQRKHARNVALNGPIQTTANMFSLASIIETVRWIQDEAFPARLVITVHDSLVLEVREDLVDEAATRLRQIMTSFPSGVVKLKADVEVGRNWGCLYKWSPGFKVPE